MPRPLYAERNGSERSLTPPEFIRRYYSAEIEKKTLHRGIIRREDPQLHKALNSWLQTHILPTDLEIPTLPEWNRKNIEERGPFTLTRTMAMLAAESDPEKGKQILRWYEVYKKYSASEKRLIAGRYAQATGTVIIPSTNQEISHVPEHKRDKAAQELPA